MRAMSSRLLILALVALAIALGLVWYAQSDRIAALPSTPIDHTRALDIPVPEHKSRVRRLTKLQREELANRIANAATLRAAAKSGSSSPPPARDPVAAHESPDPAVRKFNDRALEELGGTQTYLSECFDQHRALLPDKVTVFTRVRIFTDPDIGAYVDAQALTDEAGKPLPEKFDSCIRDMLQTFALPPLPPTDDHQFLLAFQLSFRDDD